MTHVLLAKQNSPGSCYKILQDKVLPIKCLSGWKDPVFVLKDTFFCHQFGSLKNTFRVWSSENSQSDISLRYKFHHHHQSLNAALCIHVLFCLIIMKYVLLSAFFSLPLCTEMEKSKYSTTYQGKLESILQRQCLQSHFNLEIHSIFCNAVKLDDDDSISLFNHPS